MVRKWVKKKEVITRTEVCNKAMEAPDVAWKLIHMATANVSQKRVMKIYFLKTKEWIMRFYKVIL